MKSPTECAMSFEAVKIGMTQSRDGVVLRLAIDPVLCPADLHADWVGSRYQVALVKLSDTDEPVEPRKKSEAQRAVVISGILCRDADFQDWMAHVGISEDNSEGDVTDALRSYLKIESRSDLGKNERARERFYELRDRFERFMKGKGKPE